LKNENNCPAYVFVMKNPSLPKGSMLAASMTRSASEQTYLTIRFLADRERAADAYRAYAYFRWVDDTLDTQAGLESDRSAFIQRQQSLLEKCTLGELPREVSAEEVMLVELVQHDKGKNSGLQVYLREMMKVMAFDAGRRGRLISQTELNDYTRWLAVAVTEAMHYFVGHDCFSPRDDTRYLAVSAAHITHMLRDTFDDIQAGYFNIPREVLETNSIDPGEVDSDAYRAWVRGRVELARAYFKAGREYLARVMNPRCRLAGFAYVARFEWLLDTFEREGYCLRPAYNERKSLRTGLRMGWYSLASLLGLGWKGAASMPVSRRPRSLRGL
jgi:phytoene/squalene synthetase